MINTSEPYIDKVDTSPTLDDIEDELYQYKIFITGLDGRQAHMDSYMTIMDGNAFDKMWKAIGKKYTKEQWLVWADNWIYFGYLSPTVKLFGLTVKRYANDL